MGAPASKGIMDFVNATKLLIIGCMFLTIGTFMILTYYATDIEYDEKSGTAEISRNTPIMLELGDLENGDAVYITISADDKIDILVDTVDNGREYVASHDNYDPYLLPMSSYVANSTTGTTVKLTIDERFSSGGSYSIAIIFQKTHYTGGSPTKVTFRISYPNHMTQDMCVPIGFIFILGAVSCAVAHFYLSWREKRFVPLEPKGKSKAPKPNTKTQEVKEGRSVGGGKKGTGPTKVKGPKAIKKGGPGKNGKKRTL